jgi:hypothetical protein
MKRHVAAVDVYALRWLIERLLPVMVAGVGTSFAPQRGLRCCTKALELLTPPLDHRV